MGKFRLVALLWCAILLNWGCVNETGYGEPGTATLSMPDTAPPSAPEPIIRSASQAPLSPSGNSSPSVDFQASLLAGIHINGGSVRVSVEQGDLVVNYNVIPGAVIESTHLFVGEDASLIPMNAAGAPMVGLFPHTWAATQAVSGYTQRISLQNFLPQGEQPGYLCGREFFIAAHAGLSMIDISGQVQHHSAWAEGINRFSDTTWSTYSSFTFTCAPVQCVDAVAYGGRQLSDFGINTSWGWVTTIFRREVYARPLYAQAADSGQYLYLGEFSYRYNGSRFHGEYILANGYTLEETSLYAANTPPSVDNYVLNGYSHRNVGSWYDSYEVSSMGYPFYAVAHARICAVP